MNATYQSLLERVGHYLFGVRSGFTSDQTADILDCIRDGLHRVYAAHEWSFLRPIEDVATTAPYSTGQVTIASGVVTLSGGVFPTWAPGGVLQVRNLYYAVASRESDTQVTLEQTGITVSSSSPYTLARPEIPMPAAFDSVANDSDLTYYPGEDAWFPPVKQRHDATLRKMQQRDPLFNRPVFYSVRTVNFDPTVGSRKTLALYPTPDQAYTLRVPMVLRPVMIDAINQFPIGGELLSQPILEACLAAAERNFEEREHVHEKHFMELIALAIRNDQLRTSPTSLGPDAPKVSYGKFSVVDYDYHTREQRIGRLTLDGDVL